MYDNNMQFDFRTVKNLIIDYRLERQTAALQSYSLQGALKCVGKHFSTNPSVIDF